ncbi:hypothetical protein Bca52824_078854 [Brassica carinata]|uniref:Pentatricopeptide repeat-containing protein n=1 Tax=Brassica carinata TaxID=52824 RepID=A0A8X7TYI4_BRACI|nr:hypothetical protein Bca52824_078854 [Brassica carinata]
MQKTGFVVEGFQVVGLMICSGVSVSVNVWSMLVTGTWVTIDTSLEMDLVMGNSLINYLCIVGNTTTVLKEFSSMSNKDFALDCYTYTGFLTALCQGKAPPAALNMYYEIIKMKNNLSVFKLNKVKQKATLASKREPALQDH